MTVPLATYKSKESASSLVSRLITNAATPYSAMIEVADRCNEVCVHCYQVQGQKGELPTNKWRAILEELAEMGVLFLTISGGEATLRSDFLELVAYARKLRFAVKIYTNGLTLDAALADELRALAVQEVQLSLYSPRAEVHDQVTGVPGSFKKTVGAARLLVERGIAVVVKTPLMSLNVGDYAEYARFVAELGADFSFDPTLCATETGDVAPLALGVSHSSRVAVLRDPLLASQETHALPTRERRLGSAPCGAGGSSVHIEANGELRPCALLPVPLGNAVVGGGVAAGWREHPEAQFLRTVRWRDLHGCRDCDLLPHCSRCFATALHERGDAFGPYPQACRGALSKLEARRGSPIHVEAPAGWDGAGPFRLQGDKVELIPDRVMAQDAQRAEEHPWTTSTSRGVLKEGREKSRLRRLRVLV